MLDHLYVNGTDLTTFGAFIFDKATRDAPRKNYSYITVPGRDGQLLNPTRQLENVMVDYAFVINSNVDTNLGNLRSFLLSTDGYVRIEDSQHTDEFRMGVFEGPIKIKSTRNRDMAKGVISFNCQPQRWLKSGETTLTKTGDFTIENPTIFKAAPLLRANLRSGNYGPYVSFGGVRITIDNAINTELGLTYVDVDCETQNVYNGSTNLSAYVAFGQSGTSLYGLDAPKLSPGNNSVYVSSLQSLEMTPRWWTL